MHFICEYTVLQSVLSDHHSHTNITAAIMWLRNVDDTASAIVASFSVWHVYVSLLREHSIMTFYKCLHLQSSRFVGLQGSLDS